MILRFIKGATVEAKTFAVLVFVCALSYAVAVILVDCGGGLLEVGDAGLGGSEAGAK